MFGMYSYDNMDDIYSSSTFWIIFGSVRAVFAIIGIILILNYKKGTGVRILGWYLCLSVIGLIIAVLEYKNIEKEREERIRKLEYELNENDQDEEKGVY